MTIKHTGAISFFATLFFAFFLGGYISTIDLGFVTSSKPERVAFKPLPNFKAIKDIKVRKQSFFDYLLPMVQQANAAITNERAKVLKIASKETMSTAEQSYIAKTSAKYGVSTNLAQPEQIKALLPRIDIIPPSLVLAQAANESAWGTSRFAKKGNNLFGQWCFSKGCGMVPKYRDKGSIHEVQKFASVYDSVNSYMLNINRNDAYNDVRSIRKGLRLSNSPIAGSQLANGLINYSERKEAYIDEIKNMIRFNQLGLLDKASIAPPKKQG